MQFLFIQLPSSPLVRSQVNLLLLSFHRHPYRRTPVALLVNYNVVLSLIPLTTSSLSPFLSSSCCLGGAVTKKTITAAYFGKLLTMKYFIYENSVYSLKTKTKRNHKMRKKSRF